MKQKLLILFLALAANAGIAFAETYSGTCGTNLTWTFTSEDGVLSISGEGGMYNWYSNPPVGSSTAPTYAPWHYYYVTKVVINDGATSIGRHAFYGCSNLTSVTIPNSVTSIANAFDDCHITEILFTGTLEQWCTKSWNPSSISSSYRLYINNEEMIDVIIPESVTSIGGCAFQGCSSLTSVTIPNSVTTIGNSAFYGCSSLTSITIPNSVTSIGDYTFYGCSSLTSITIPNSVTSIGDYTFYGCSSLTSVTIPNRVKTIAFNAFYDCPIAEIRFMGTLEQWCKKLWGHFSHPMYRLYINNEELTDVVIPESVKSIKDYTFQNCSSLTSVTISNSVTSIGKSAFEDCSSLTSVTIGKSVTSIGEKAFNGCSSLTTLSLNAYAIASQAYSSYYGGISRFFPNSSIQNLIIGDAITAIGQYAFWGCGSLTSVTISNSVTSIGKEALGGCSEIYFTGDLEQWINKQWNPTQITSKKYILYIEKQKTSNIVVPNSVTSIRDSTFYNCSSLTSVTIPNNVTSIGDGAFSNCSSLTSVTIPNSVTSIGDGAFSNCSSLTKVVIGDGATSIGQEAFYGCTYLEDITIGSGINVDNGIGENAFNGCRYLLSVTCKAIYPPVINANVFEGCGVLGGVDLNVPEKSVARYKKADVWSEFNIVGKDLSVDDPTNPTNPEDGKYTITWQDEDGNVIKTDQVAQGTTPAFTGTTPTKPATNEYTYEFEGWLPKIQPATKDMYYTTFFERNKIETPVYTVNINGENCSLNINNQYPEGTVITLEAVADECFEFRQWSDGNKDNPRTITVTANTNLTAEFNKVRYTITDKTEPGTGGKIQIVGQ